MKNLIASVALIIILPAVVFANGGDQRVVENKYLVNLSRSPFTPRVALKTAMIVSFVDLKKNKLIGEDLMVKVRISKFGGTGSAKRTCIFEKNDIVVKEGVLELSYTFTESGLHEVFFDFAFASNPQKIYEAPDFLLDIEEPIVKESFAYVSLITGMASALMGFGVGFLIWRRKEA